MVAEAARAARARLPLSAAGAAREPVRHAPVLQVAARKRAGALLGRERQAIHARDCTSAFGGARRVALSPSGAARTHGERKIERTRCRAHPCRKDREKVEAAGDRDRGLERRCVVGNDAPLSTRFWAARPTTRSRYVQHISGALAHFTLAARPRLSQPCAVPRRHPHAGELGLGPFANRLRARARSEPCRVGAPAASQPRGRARGGGKLGGSTREQPRWHPFTKRF